jgi:metal-sulfur cluster biosynthetic enzyme
MDGGRTQLRDRMLRDAIVEVLRGTFDASGDGEAVSLVDAGLIGHVTVEGDRVRVQLALPPEWSPVANSLAAEVQRRVQALPEVTRSEITVNPGQPSEDRDDRQGETTSPASQPG